MDESHGIEEKVRDPLEPPRGASPIHPWMELVLCVAGSLATVLLSGIGTFAMVYGAWRLFRPEENRGLWAVAGCLAPAIALCFVSVLDYGLLVLPCSVCALVIARLLPGHATVTNVCLTVLLLAAAMIGADALFANAIGFDNIVSYQNALISEIREQTIASVGGKSASISTMASLDQTLELFSLAWPFGYIAQAGIVVGFGFLGLALTRRVRYADAYASFTRYDSPLWVVVLLIVGIISTLLSGAVTDVSVVFKTIGVNALLVARVLFLIQGMAALLGVMDRRGFGTGSRVALLVCAFFAEMMFFAVCVFGLVDIWADFRKLRHTKEDESRGLPRASE